MSGVQKSSYSRTWLIQYGADPHRTPAYQSWTKAGSIDYSTGDVTRIRVPSDVLRGKFDEVDIIRGEDDRPTISLMRRMTADKVSVFKTLVDSACVSDIQIHFGKCQSVTQYNGGWDKIIDFEDAYVTNYSTTELGAMDQTEDAAVDETIDISGKWFYEIVPLSLAERAASTVGQEIISINVCDIPQCGDCGGASDGSLKVFAVSAPAVGSPGVLPEVVYSDDGFVTSGDTWIDTLAIGEDPTGAECVDPYLAVVSNASNSLHYANKTDILNGAETWAEVTTGFVAGFEPNCIVAADPSHVWIGADAGYIYFSSDIVSGVSVQDEAVATTEDINAIDCYGTDVVVAVGDNNAVVYTSDGETWAAVTGPDTSNTPNLISVAVRDEKTWVVGTADNAAWYTTDEGVSWTQMRFPGDTATGGGTGSVHDIKFPTRAVGYLAHETSAPAGRILRTTDGGHSWYVLPESGSAIPANDRINSLAVPYRNANVVYGGGLADNAADGIIVKGSA